MRKVFLIDDEPWAIESLARTLPWEEHGFVVAARYTCALEAWEALKREVPEVAFIDIRMPDMTGLEIAERAKRINLNTLFVIVSGHEEFEYAQRAMRLDVFDYCLKPVDETEGDALLKRVAGKLSQDASSRYAHLCECILDQLPLSSAFRGFEADGPNWQAAVLRYVEDSMEAMIYRALDGMRYLPMKMGARKLLLLLNGGPDLGEQTCERLAGLPDKRPFIGVSRVSASRADVSRMLTEAQFGAYREFIAMEPRIITYNDTANRTLADCAEALKNAVDSYDIDAFVRRLEDLRRISVEEPIQMWQLAQVWNLLMDAFAQSDAADALSGAQRVYEPDEMPYLFGVFENMLGTLRFMMEKHAHGRTEAQSENINESFLELVTYVERNYTQRGMRLTDLAERFHLNLAYCSELFHKVVGMTYTDYLIKLRMDHAMRSIREGNVNLQQLAFSLGYGDYFTFSKRFKQYHGFSPSHYTE